MINSWKKLVQEYPIKRIMYCRPKKAIDFPHIAVMCNESKLRGDLDVNKQTCSFCFLSIIVFTCKTSIPVATCREVRVNNSDELWNWQVDCNHV